MPNLRNSILVCFAVAEEAQAFNARVRLGEGIRICTTGMGERNARLGFLNQISRATPHFVITSGFAGALSARLKAGDIVWDRDPGFPPVGALRSTEGSATFTHANRVTWNAAQKAELRRETGADVVDMESKVIRSECARLGIASATVRVISDTAAEDLPMDFNLVMSSDMRINWMKLIRHVVRHPRTVSNLLRFRSQVQRCGHVLASALSSMTEELVRMETHASS